MPSRPRLLVLLATALFVIGAIADARDEGTVFSQSPMFWLLMGLGAAVLAWGEGR